MTSPCQHPSPPVGDPNKGVHYTPSVCRGQCPLSGLWLWTCQISSSSSELAGGMIWTWWLWNGRPSRRWAWLLFVLRLLWCVIFILISVRIRYDFSYFISWQHTSPFRTWNIATFHSQRNFSTANASNSNISTERNRNSASCLVV